MEMTEDKTINYVSLSTILHALLFVAATIVSANMNLLKPLPEVVEIQIMSPPVAALPEPSRPAAALPKTLPPKALLPKKSEAVVKIPKMKSVAKVATAKSPPAKFSKAVVKSAGLVTPTNVYSEVEAPILETPELEAPTVIAAADLDDSVLNDDFEKIDKETSKNLMAAKADIDREGTAALNETDNSLADLKQQALDDDAKMKAISASERQREQSALAQAQAERAASAAAAAAAATAAAKAAKAQAVASNGNGGNGVRDISQLRQSPGNRKPDYDSDDRFHKREGEILFRAYVTRDGHLTDFKLLRSSGHRTLDLKTLKAIREWKFLPGQEGMVEIPYQWVLKGGPQERPTTLRRKISTN